MPAPGLTGRGSPSQSRVITSLRRSDATPSVARVPQERSRWSASMLSPNATPPASIRDVIWTGTSSMSASVSSALVWTLGHASQTKSNRAGSLGLRAMGQSPCDGTRSRCHGSARLSKRWWRSPTHAVVAVLRGGIGFVSRSFALCGCSEKDGCVAEDRDTGGEGHHERGAVPHVTDKPRAREPGCNDGEQCDGSDCNQRRLAAKSGSYGR
jgi:hypothetical protein